MDWNQLIEWDRKYYMHGKASREEYRPSPVVRTEGVYMVDRDGRRILDMHNGSSVNAGHGNARIIGEIKNALDRYGFVWESYLTDYRAEVSKLIVEDLVGADGWAGKTRFVASGSEAVEEALLVAKLYTQRPFVISMNWSYHGWTEGAGSCTATRNSRNILISSKDRKVYGVPGMPASGYHFVQPPYAYRCPFGPGCADCDEAALGELEHLIMALGPEKVAAVITDIVLGGAAIVLSRTYVEGVRRITREHGIVWIDDEVITGFGRTGRWFCYQHYDVPPDIMVMGKGISSNYIPAGGIVISREIAEFFDAYRWSHMPTNSGHPIGMAAILGNIRFMMEEKIPEHVARLGAQVESRLAALERAHRCVGHYEGMGLLWGIEIVKDKATREPVVKEDREFVTMGDTAGWPSQFILKKCLERDVYISGIFPNTLRIIPPLTITADELDTAMDALDHALTAFDRTLA